MHGYNILSFDGGGVCGVREIRIVQRILKWYKNQFINDATVLAGTSAGSFIALGLAVGIEPEAILSMFWDNAHAIFPRDNVVERFAGAFESLYDNTPLKRVLIGVFGTKTLKDAKKSVLIPTFQLDYEQNGTRAWRPKIYKNFGTDVDTNGLSTSIVDICMESSAAPIYFPTYKGFIDGGVAANNPSLVAALNLMSQLDCTPDKLSVFSMGAGFSPEYIEGDELDWGLLNWATKLVDVFMAGNSGIIHQTCKQLFKDKYFRSDVIYNRTVGLDDSSSTSYILSTADAEDLKPAVEWIDKNW